MRRRIWAMALNPCVRVSETPFAGRSPLPLYVKSRAKGSKAVQSPAMFSSVVILMHPRRVR